MLCTAEFCPWYILLPFGFTGPWSLPRLCDVKTTLDVAVGTNFIILNLNDHQWCVSISCSLRVAVLEAKLMPLGIAKACS